MAARVNQYYSDIQADNGWAPLAQGSNTASRCPSVQLRGHTCVNHINLQHGTKNNKMAPKTTTDSTMLSMYTSTHSTGHIQLHKLAQQNHSFCCGTVRPCKPAAVLHSMWWWSHLCAHDSSTHPVQPPPAGKGTAVETSLLTEPFVNKQNPFITCPLEALSVSKSKLRAVLAARAAVLFAGQVSLKNRRCPQPAASCSTSIP